MLVHTTLIINFTLKNFKMWVAWILFLICLNIYLINPFLNNIADPFFTIDQILKIMFIGTIIFTLIVGSTLRNYLLSISYILGPYNIKYANKLPLVIMMGVFTLLHIVNFIVLLGIHHIRFSLDIHTTYFLFKLYFNYIYLALLVSILIGYTVAITNLNKLIVFPVCMIIILLWFYISSFKYNFLSVSSNGFYSPFNSIIELNYNFTIKIILLLILLVLTVFSIHMKNKFKNYVWLFSLFLLIVTLPFKPNNSEEFIYEYYVDSYIDILESNNSNNSLRTDYSISEYKVSIKDNTKMNFKVEINLNDIGSNTIDFFLNKAFHVEEVKQNAQEIKFVQDENKLTLELNEKGSSWVSINYNTYGTSLNPVHKEFIYLPFYSNWLPSSSSKKEFFIRDQVNVEYTSNKLECEYPITIDTDDVEQVYSIEENNCLTILKGDFNHISTSQLDLYIPTIWNVNLGNVEDYQRLYESIIESFNNVFNQDLEISLGGLVIVPKYELTASMSVNDFRTHNDYHYLHLDPFIDTNRNSVFYYINNNLMYNITYDSLREKINESNEKEIENLSIYFGIYYAQSIGLNYSSYYVNRLIEMDSEEEVFKFIEMNSETQKKYLRKLFKDLH